MICPKCGSEIIHLGSMIYGCINYGDGCNFEMDIIESLAYSHQQRIGDLLTKFKQVGLFNHLYICKGFTFNYNNHSKQFTLFRAVLEIDTMEKLIRDLESDK